MNIITLYRGDSSKIDEFDFKKTDKKCLVGQGIYLTTRKNVADTYRTKGSRRVLEIIKNKTILFNGKAVHKQHAQEIAYGRYVTQILKKKIEQATSFDHYGFLDLIEEGLITVEITRPVSHAGIKTIECTYTHYKNKPKIVGYISEFHFPEKLFNDSMLLLDRNTPVEFLEMFYINGCVDENIQIQRYKFRSAFTVLPNGNKTPTTERELVTLKFNLTNFDIFKNLVRENGFPYRALNYQKVRRILEEYGYRGLEYPGGMITNNVSHRAFCVWDEDFVNEHKVKIYK